MNKFDLSFKSMREVSFPNNIQTFNLISFQNTISIIITIYTLYLQNVENFTCCLRGDKVSCSLAIVILFEVSFEIFSIFNSRNFANVPQSKVKRMKYSYFLIASATFFPASAEYPCFSEDTHKQETIERKKVKTMMIFISSINVFLIKIFAIFSQNNPSFDRIHRILSRIK